MKTLFHRLWSKRAVRATIWTLVSLVTLAVLLIRLIDWQANRRWSAIRETLASEGETLEFRALFPEPVADESNFCATPSLHSIADEAAGKVNRESLGVFELKAREGKKLPTPGNPALTGKRPDLAPWIDALTDTPEAGPQDLLAAFSAQDSIIAELSGVLDRPSAQWTPTWKSRELPAFLFALPLPHYTTSQNLTKSLAVRSLAEVQRANAAAAHANLRLIARLAEANTSDPFLIGLLVGCAQSSLAANGAWTLCEARLGTVEDFAQLEADFARLDFTRAAQLAWRGELAAGTSSINAMAGSASDRRQLLDNSEFSNLHLVPRGMLRNNAAVLAELQWKHCLKPLKEGGLPALQDGAVAFEDSLEDLRRSPLQKAGSFLAILAMPANASIASTSIQAQALATQAGIACALERHFLTHQQYPASLSELGSVDTIDPWTGGEMRYEKTPNGRYRIWSVGPDRVDDGGKRNLDPADPAKTKFRDSAYRGDWVWSYAD
jgi:hypothetical protein